MTTIGELLEEMAAHLLDSDFDHFAPVFMPDGSARQRQWTAEDGWIVVYTTERVDRGRWAEKFVTMLYKPEGKGARTGKAVRWRRVYARPFATRKAAKARAMALYADHSPKWKAKYGRDGRSRIRPDAAFDPEGGAA
jgi:hypothetical protein